MARLHEHQGKQILSAAGIRVPTGSVARSPEEAAQIANSLGAPVMVKVQAWTTGRAAAGGIARAQTPDEARRHASRMLAMSFGSFPVTEVLIEKCLEISRELFVSLAIDEKERAPILLISAAGGSGVEARAATTHRLLCNVERGPVRAELVAVIESLGASQDVSAEIEKAILAMFAVARSIDARSLEINPLAITADGKVVAADCRLTIDDYAVVRHPELGIELARELDHPPTGLERAAYRIEQEDHRGTFFFAQMNTVRPAGGKGLVGFHGAGGGGSMMSMDALSAEGFTPANFCDTSGNPSPAKVYRAARIILSQPGLVGYFGSGSGVANQEQFWSAYGLAKAFWELELSIPAVVRLGGNSEDRAVDILQSVASELKVAVEGYKKTDPPSTIARRFSALVEQHCQASPAKTEWSPRIPRRPDFVGSPDSFSFDLNAGKVWIEGAVWARKSAAIISRSAGLLRNSQGRPAITLPQAEFATKDSDFIACEVECRRDGVGGVFVDLHFPTIDRQQAGEAAH